MNGSAKHDPQRINRDEPKAVGVPVPPPWLPEAGPAREAWNRLLPILQGMRVLSAGDAEALALCCTALEEYAAARQADDWRRADSAWKRYSSMLTQFGLTPSSRSKVSIVPVTKDDPLKEWMSR